MVGCNRNEGRAEQRVGAGGEDGNMVLRRRKLEAELQPLRLADPVLLHRPHFLGPRIERAEAVEQFLGEIGDFQEPLRQLAPLDQRARTPAAPVDDLFIGQHGVVDRIPVDEAFLAGDQPRRHQIEEQRLFMAIIIGIAGGEFAAPVDRQAQPLQLRLHRRDIGAGPAAGVDALFHRRILGRHAKGIPTHRVQHRMAGHALIAGDDVTHGVIAHMPHMDAARWVGKHLEHIGWGPLGVAIGAEGFGAFPRRLPARIGGHRVEPLVGHACFLKVFHFIATKAESLSLSKGCPSSRPEE